MDQRRVPADRLDVEHQRPSGPEARAGERHRLAGDEMERDRGAPERVEKDHVPAVLRGGEEAPAVLVMNDRIAVAEAEELVRESGHGRVDLDRLDLPAAPGEEPGHAAASEADQQEPGAARVELAGELADDRVGKQGCPGLAVDLRVDAAVHEQAAAALALEHPELGVGAVAE